MLTRFNLKLIVLVLMLLSGCAKSQEYTALVRGENYANKRMYDKAIAEYDKALQINPGYALAYYNRANAYARSMQFDKAILDYTKTIEIMKKNRTRLYLDDVYYNRACVYKAKGELDEAINDYTTAITLNPGRPDAYNNRGIAYYDKGENDKAEQDFRKAERLGYKVNRQAIINRKMLMSDEMKDKIRGMMKNK